MGLWLYYRNERQKLLSSRGKLETAGQVGAPQIGGPFNLLDSDGREFSDKDLLGKYYLLYFGFTHCPDICPEELSKIAEAVEIVKMSDSTAPLLPVFITCDPERDTPSIIKSYLKGMSSWTGMTSNLP